MQSKTQQLEYKNAASSVHVCGSEVFLARRQFDHGEDPLQKGGGEEAKEGNRQVSGKALPFQLPLFCHLHLILRSLSTQRGMLMLLFETKSRI